MKKLLIAAGLGFSFTLLTAFSAKADGPRDRDHDRFRDRREQNDGDRFRDRRDIRDNDRFRDRREWRDRDRYERPRYYEHCRPGAYFYWH
jgi:hypothetical protein